MDILTQRNIMKFLTVEYTNIHYMLSTEGKNKEDKEEEKLKVHEKFQAFC